MRDEKVACYPGCSLMMELLKQSWSLDDCCALSNVRCALQKKSHVPKPS